ncbi:MAG: hypothetical protein HC866_21250 [Leptolyngbyaceae cyanobacterium RU_5_1]|nr:hypothetical protein [Leptolyngbyaceae cyanobacterium RU_5_1]
MKDVIENRMKQLGFSEYRVTKEVCQLRAQDGEVPPITKYHSSIRQAIDKPENVKFYIIEDIVKAMGGEIVIRWHNIEEVKAT